MLPPALGLLKLIAAVDELPHKVWLVTVFTEAVGFTVMVNVIGVPTQLTPLLVNVGVTVMVAVTGANTVLVALNEPIFPVPLAAKPIDVLLFAQV